MRKILLCTTNPLTRIITLDPAYNRRVLRSLFIPDDENSNRRTFFSSLNPQVLFSDPEFSWVTPLLHNTGLSFERNYTMNTASVL